MISRSVGLMAIAAPLASAVTGIDSFYPPNLANVSYINDTSIGTYGGVYQSPTRDSNTTQPYGTYDYCQMPHPRVTEYQLPGPIANGTLTGNLVFLEYVQRHQRRTPYNILPGGENEPFQCDDVFPYLYAGPQQGVAPLPVYAQTYTDPNNPFVSSYVTGSCQYPQITIGGYLDGVQHGKDLWAVYGDKLGLLPNIPDDTVKIRTTESPLTQGTAGAVTRGLWPNYAGPLPMLQQTSAVDTVNQGFPCAARSNILTAIENTAVWKQHLAAVNATLTKFGTQLGANTSAWITTLDHLNDNFQGRLCNGYALPCNVKNSSDCVTLDQANQIFRGGDWEWNYYWRTNPNVTAYIQSVQGLFIGEIIRDLQGVVNGTSSLKYRHVFVHDGDVGPLAGALGINQLRWPAMASNIAIEIWKTSNSTNPFYARVLYSGQPIRTIHGVLDWLPVQGLIDILSPFVPKDIVAFCNSVPSS